MDPLSIPRQTVVSSNIKAIGYDEPTKTLTVEFKGGAVYSYVPVTKDFYREFLMADSHGQHFDQHLKYNKQVTCTKIQSKSK